MNNLTKSNFLLYCAKYYDKTILSNEEFLEDCKRFQYLKRLCNKYKETGDLKDRLILNHLIILFNVFTPPQVCSTLLYFKLEDSFDVLKPFLLYLQLLPERITINGKLIHTTDIVMDQQVVDRLREQNAYFFKFFTQN